MATATRKLRSLDVLCPLAGPPPLSSPTKRSSTSSLAGGPEGSPRVLRTKLSNDQDAVRLELAVDEVEASRGDRLHDPSTPPESSFECAEASGTAPQEQRSRKGTPTASEGATQTATAERQSRQLAALPAAEQHALARLCSQHPSSEYNNLKRAVAYAAPGAQSVQHIHAHQPMPPLRHTQSAGPSAPTARPVAPARTASAGALVSPRPTRENRPPGSIQTPPRSTLTPSLARVNFDFSLSSKPIASPTPVQVEQRSAAEHTVDTILTDLVDGEPVSVERTPTKVVVTDAVPAVPPPVTQNHAHPAPAIPGLLPGMEMINGVPVKTSVSHPINISPIVPPDLLAYYASQVFASSSADSPSDYSHQSPVSFVLRPRAACDLLTLTTPDQAGYFPSLPAHPHSSSSSSLDALSHIGNFMLSSCPGKKVRMNGESLRGGRGAICRDVKIDLARAKDEGVRMVVCCLDDAELAYLGTPFEEYAAACSALELEILRIPMVEGFAPSSPASLDAQLDRLIRNHTLVGASVLAHCRGGIGRAGLVASCWMIKMGMVNSRAGLDDEADSSRPRTNWVDEAPMIIVERVIELIRKRRSVKAIETTQQVKFLLEYVQFLQENARFVPASDLVGTASPA